MPTIYRKYRPGKFSEISGQEHIVRTLSNAIAHGRVGHAYLLTGPRGTGKTTLARIFAKTLNCLEPQKQPSKGPVVPTASVEPCGKCENCKLISQNKSLDIIEIDAASHTGVDNIRQLKEAIPLPPTSLKYKVYIIDEVHMLSTGAFNALLKTLEEPPNHAIFILATTELHKVPETIISRCQRFEVNNLSTQQIIKRLGQIAKAEKVRIDDEALETIALEAEGGMRDAESLFGQILSLEDKEITAEETHSILGTSPRPLAIQFVHELIGKNTAKCLEKIDEMEKDGVNLKNFNKLLLHYLRNLLLMKTSSGLKNSPAISLNREQAEKARKDLEKISLQSLLFLIELMQKSISRFKETAIPQLPLELAVIEFHISFEENKTPETSSPGQNAQNFKPPASKPRQAPQNETDTGVPLPEAQELASKIVEPPRSTEKKNTPGKISRQEPAKESGQGNPTSNPRPLNKDISDILDAWSDILEKIKPQNHSIGAFLKNCVPCGIKDGTLYIKTKYDFYKDKLSEAENRLTVQKTIATIIGASVKVVFLTEKEADSLVFEDKTDSKEKRNVLHDAMQVFGGRIVK